MTRRKKSLSRRGQYLMKNKGTVAFALVYNEAGVEVIFYHNDGRRATSYSRTLSAHCLDQLVNFTHRPEFNIAVFPMGWSAWLKE